MIHASAEHNDDISRPRPACMTPSIRKMFRALGRTVGNVMLLVAILAAATTEKQTRHFQVPRRMDALGASSLVPDRDTPLRHSQVVGVSVSCLALMAGRWFDRVLPTFVAADITEAATFLAA
jgi:hypothetical protein